jgi:3-oxoacyl-[acyl-carrier protein] reductase
LWGFAKSVAIENASYNITINTINLGYAETGMIQTVPEEYRRNILAQIPAGRFCSGKEILNTISYIMNTAYLTGSAIDLNGGLV